MAVRILRPDANILQTSGAILIASSQQTSMTVGGILRGVRWRSSSGWTIVTGVNDKIDFNRGGLNIATVAAGTYATGALLAAAIVTALEAADPTPVWACSQSGTTFKFTISSDLAFTLVFSTGISFVESIHVDIGYADTDTGSATSHTAGSAAYQSRHWINVDLVSAQPATVAIVRGHNLSTAGIVRMDGNATSLIAEGIGVGGSYDYAQTLAGTDLRVVFFASQSKRYLRLVITDVQNAAGYIELGVWSVGAYAQLSVLPSVTYAKDNEHLSEVHFAEGGANHQILRARRRVYRLLFQLEERGGLAVADRAIFNALDALGIGANFFQSFDHPSDGVVTVYGFNRVGLHEVYVGGTIWSITQELAEALG